MDPKENVQDKVTQMLKSIGQDDKPNPEASSSDPTQEVLNSPQPLPVQQAPVNGNPSQSQDPQQAPTPIAQDGTLAEPTLEVVCDTYTTPVVEQITFDNGFEVVSDEVLSSDREQINTGDVVYLDIADTTNAPQPIGANLGVGQYGTSADAVQEAQNKSLHDRINQIL